MAGEFVRAQTLLHDVYGYLYCKLSFLWNSSQPRLSLTIPRASRSRRWRLAAYGATNSGRYLPPGEARPGIFCLRHYSSLCPSDWANPRRLANRYCVLEMDFPDQPAWWPSGDGALISIG